MAKQKKNIANIKHPNSRKAQAMTKEIRRNKTTKNKIKFNQLMKKSLVAERLEFFRQITQDKTGCSPEDLSKFIENVYLTRFDDELKYLEERNSRYKNTNNSSKKGRLDAIKMTKEKEVNEFKYHGMELPDLLDQEQFKLLAEWEGDLESIPKFKLKKYNCQELHDLHKEWTKHNVVNTG